MAKEILVFVNFLKGRHIGITLVQDEPLSCALKMQFRTAFVLINVYVVAEKEILCRMRFK